MDVIEYPVAGVSEELKRAHRDLWEYLSSPGVWFDGSQKVAIAAESRRALDCELCGRRKEALSPNAVSGEHDHVGRFDDTVVDVIHRVRTDSGRLSRAWFERVTQTLEVPAYVELVGLVAFVAGVDSMARAMGMAPFPLPRSRPGEPSRYRPGAAKNAGAWVSMIAPEDASGPEANLYPPGAFVPNIARALSLIPGHARMLQQLSSAHYFSIEQISDPSARRTLDRMQIELVAARVSALNQCFY